jgi:protein SCO1/2
MRDRLTRRHGLVVSALGAIGVITAGWWALALWPAPTDAPAWLGRTRAVCFGVGDSGLPDAAGWAVLIGQPASMLAVLLFGWWRTTIEALRIAALSRPGRVALAATALLVMTGASAATVRVAAAAEAARFTLDGPARAASELPRLHRAAPALDLVDQDGESFMVERLRGRTALVTFAFAHCETVCPLLVREVRRARQLARDRGLAPPAVVVITVDPWRDTPTRLPHIAEGWGFSGDEWVLSGEPDAVRAALDRWNVSTTRDARTGEITHPAVVHVIDPEGRIAFTTTGGGEHALALLARLD